MAATDSSDLKTADLNSSDLAPGGSEELGEVRQTSVDQTEPGGKVLPDGLWGRVARFIDTPYVSRIFAVFVVIASLAAGTATFLVFSSSETTPDADPDQLVSLLYLDLVLLLLIVAIITRRVIRLWSERRQGAAGSRMHMRLSAMFGALAIAPAIIVAGFSLLFFNFGLESWFSDRVRTAVSSSEAVADAYLEEHLRNIEADALFIANGINRDAAVFSNDIALLERALNFQAANRGLSEGLVFEDNGRILGRAGITLVLEFEPIPTSAKVRARNGEVVILRSDADDRVRALVRLDNIIDTFLIVGRTIDRTVIDHVEETQGAARQFERLEEERSRFQISFALAFVMVAMLLLLTAVWIGLTVATGLSEPISGLIAATEQVRGGNLDTQVSTSERNDEFDILSRAFNRMTEQLRGQRNELLQANQQIDQRRRFTETVLAGVSAGVIGLDRDGNIELPNQRAGELTGLPLDEYFGHELAAIVPELAPIMRKAIASGDRHDFFEEEIRLGAEGAPRSLIVRIGALTRGDEESGYVLTLDDITDLASAQRKAAWADVARRIAHEIKNPLTPIQLSAERLKRKYMRDIQNDPAVFETCVDTIIRQVEDIGHMVDEFSNFARMPAPTMHDTDLCDLLRQQVFLQRNANPEIEYLQEIPGDPIHRHCDSRQIAQVLTNVLQNAKEAIDGRGAKPSGAKEGAAKESAAREGAPMDKDAELPQGMIEVSLRSAGSDVVIEITDNGRGLPLDDRDRLTEPYVTTREKGTGLGLAIVKKIMEDHGGSIQLSDAPSGSGARIVLRFGPDGRDMVQGDPTQAV